MNYQYCICSSVENIFNMDTVAYICPYYPDMGNMDIEFKILIFY